MHNVKAFRDGVPFDMTYATTPPLTERRTSPSPSMPYLRNHLPELPQHFSRMALFQCWTSVLEWLKDLLKDIFKCLGKPYEDLSVLDSGPLTAKAGEYHVFYPHREVIPIEPSTDQSGHVDRNQQVLIDGCSLDPFFLGPAHLPKVELVPTSDEMSHILEFREYHRKEMLKRYSHLFYLSILIEETLIPTVNEEISRLNPFGEEDSLSESEVEDVDIEVNVNVNEYWEELQEDDLNVDEEVLDANEDEEVDIIVGNEVGANEDEEVDITEELQDDEVKISIKLIGIGSGASKVVNKIAGTMTGRSAIELHLMDSDKKMSDLALVHPSNMLLIGDGRKIIPELGMYDASRSKVYIENAIKGADLVILLVGMGGGTGTGASPVIAAIAKSMNILTVGVVSTPFEVEGQVRASWAKDGIVSLRNNVDMLVKINNERLDEMSKLATPDDADNALLHCIRALSDILMVNVVQVKLDDIHSVLQDTGLSSMGRGSATGKSRSEEATLKAVGSPILEIEIERAKSIILNITGGPDLTMSEVDCAVTTIANLASGDARIIYGAVIDPSLGLQVAVTLILTD